MTTLKLGSNMTLVMSQDQSIHILISYATPVAGYILGKGFIRTSKWFSSTTSKHINKYLGGNVAAELSQEELDNLYKSL